MLYPFFINVDLCNSEQKDAMKRLHVIFAVCMAVAGVGHAQTSLDEQVIRKTISNWNRALENDDVKTLSTMITDDSEFVLVNGKSLKGRDDFSKYYGNIYPNLYKWFNRGRSFPTEVRFISPDVALVHEFVMFGFKDLSSVKGARTTHDTILLIRKSEQWLVNSAQTVLLHGTKATIAEYAMMPYPKALNYT